MGIVLDLDTAVEGGMPLFDMVQRFWMSNEGTTDDFMTLEGMLFCKFKCERDEEGENNTRRCVVVMER